MHGTNTPAQALDSRKNVKTAHFLRPIPGIWEPDFGNSVGNQQEHAFQYFSSVFLGVQVDLSSFAEVVFTLMVVIKGIRSSFGS